MFGTWKLSLRFFRFLGIGWLLYDYPYLYFGTQQYQWSWIAMWFFPYHHFISVILTINILLKLGVLQICRPCLLSTYVLLIFDDFLVSLGIFSHRAVAQVASLLLVKKRWRVRSWFKRVACNLPIKKCLLIFRCLL